MKVITSVDELENLIIEKSKNQDNDKFTSDEVPEGLTVQQYIDLYNTDYNAWVELNHKPMGWYDIDNCSVYLPNNNVFHTETLLRQTKNPREKSWILTDNYPSFAITWTIVCNPLTWFALNYKYFSNKPWFNITGHPRSFHMIGINSIAENIEKKLPLMDQTGTICSYNHPIDLIIYNEVLIASFYHKDKSEIGKYTDDERFQRSLFNNHLHIIFKESHPWTSYYRDLFIRYTPYNGIPNGLCPIVRRNVYIEESVHDHIINNDHLLIALKNKYARDYKNFAISDTVEKMRFDHYWNLMEHEYHHV